MTDAKQNSGTSSRAGRKAAGLQRGHFAVVVQAAQSQHHRQQQADRHDNRQIHDRPERDQIEYHVPAVLVVRRLAEHPGQLVGHQNRHQNPGYREPGLHDFAQHISLHCPFHSVELRAFVII